MVIQYPHTLTYATAGTPDVWDDVNGGWIPGTPGATFEVSCRAIPAGAGNKGQQIKNQDGVMVDYDYDLAFPLGTDRIPDGTVVTITAQDGVVLVSSPLLQFAVGQLHCRGWV